MYEGTEAPSAYDETDPPTEDDWETDPPTEVDDLCARFFGDNAGSPCHADGCLDDAASAEECCASCDAAPSPPAQE